ncbi:MAG: maleylpyruvate isomerase family mycothiol-dependent enzyme [Chloroflexi bacterium]|nr:maleylpyruvate isomerase family mycothiol-dependent enzyme [Chloroflexota bacterium]
MNDPDVSRCLRAIRERSAAISGVVRPLTAEQWQGESNCPPWRVADLASHTVTSGQGFARSIRRGLEGTVEPAPASAHPLVDTPTEVADGLALVTDEFESLYADLSDAQLETVCFHRRGNRSVRWYAAHRLAELAFHAWDLDVSLGRRAAMSDEVAALLLPTLLESNVPRTYAAGLSAERGAGERYLLGVAGDASARWLVVITPEALEVVRGGDSRPDLSITADAATLALLVYGRADLGEAQLHGSPEFVERFRKTFPRP